MSDPTPPNQNSLLSFANRSVVVAQAHHELREYLTALQAGGNQTASISEVLAILRY
jgi:hypothetical protein